MRVFGLLFTRDGGHRDSSPGMFGVSVIRLGGFLTRIRRKEDILENCPHVGLGFRVWGFGGVARVLTPTALEAEKR